MSSIASTIDSIEFLSECDYCAVDSDATCVNICSQCLVQLCDIHTESHKNTRILACHQLIPFCNILEFDRYKELNINRRILKYATTCSAHSPHIADMFCLDCKKVACIYCSHNTHDIKCVFDVYSELIEKFKNIYLNLSECLKNEAILELEEIQKVESYASKELESRQQNIKRNFQPLFLEILNKKDFMTRRISKLECMISNSGVDDENPFLFLNGISDFIKNLDDEQKASTPLINQVLPPTQAIPYEEIHIDNILNTLAQVETRYIYKKTISKASGISDHWESFQVGKYKFELNILRSNDYFEVYLCSNDNIKCFYTFAFQNIFLKSHFIPKGFFV